MRFGFVITIFMIVLIIPMGSQAIGETVFDNFEAVWEEIETETHPSKRHDFDLDYDPVNDVALLFGGNDGPINGETWIYHPQNETWMEIIGPSPSPRSHSETVYVPTLGKFLLYGGTNGTNQFIYDMWTFDASTLTWEEIYFTNQPLVSMYQRTAYIPTTNTILSWGGYGIDGGLVYDTDMWQFHLHNNTWQQMTTDVTPNGRNEHSFYYDPANDWLVLYGGGDESKTQLDDTWIYNYRENTWKELHPANTPYQKNNHEITGDMGYMYDPVYNVSYITRDFLLWYLDYRPDQENVSWIELPTQETDIGYVLWVQSSGITYIDSIDKFLAFGGYDFISPDSSNYKDKTISLTITRPQTDNSDTTIHESTDVTLTTTSNPSSSLEESSTSDVVGQNMVVGLFFVAVVKIKYHRSRYYYHK